MSKSWEREREKGWEGTKEDFWGQLPNEGTREQKKKSPLNPEWWPEASSRGESVSYGRAGARPTDSKQGRGSYGSAEPWPVYVPHSDDGEALNWSHAVGD